MILTSPSGLRRRDVLKGAVALAGAAFVAEVASAAKQCRATPLTEEGDLYPAEKVSWANDLTNVPGGNGVADGRIVCLWGLITTTDDRPLIGAVIETWQADGRGYYKHPHHSESAVLDPNFKYYGKVHSDQTGRYEIKTVMPSAYRTYDVERAAHVHIKVRSREHGVITTEMYFSGIDQNKQRASDPVFQKRQHKESLIAQQQSAVGLESNTDVFRFDLVYQA